LLRVRTALLDKRSLGAGRDFLEHNYTRSVYTAMPAPDVDFVKAQSSKKAPCQSVKQLTRVTPSVSCTTSWDTTYHRAGLRNLALCLRASKAPLPDKAGDAALTGERLEGEFDACGLFMNLRPGRFAARSSWTKRLRLSQKQSLSC